MGEYELLPLYQAPWARWVLDTSLYQGKRGAEVMSSDIFSVV